VCVCVHNHIDTNLMCTMRTIMYECITLGAHSVYDMYCALHGIRGAIIEKSVG
jgi:hypothetical protein